MCKYCKYFAACASILWTHHFYHLLTFDGPPFKLSESLNSSIGGLKVSHARGDSEEELMRWAKAPAFIYSKHIVPGHHIVWYRTVHQMLTTGITHVRRSVPCFNPCKKEKFSSMKLILGAGVKAFYNQIKRTWGNSVHHQGSSSGVDSNNLCIGGMHLLIRQ